MTGYFLTFATHRSKANLSENHSSQSKLPAWPAELLLRPENWESCSHFGSEGSSVDAPLLHPGLKKNPTEMKSHVLFIYFCHMSLAAVLRTLFLFLFCFFPLISETAVRPWSGLDQWTPSCTKSWTSLLCLPGPEKKAHRSSYDGESMKWEWSPLHSPQRAWGGAAAAWRANVLPECVFTRL